MIGTSGLKVLVVEDNAESRAATIDDILRALPDADICWAADEAMLKDYTDCFEEYVSPEDANMMEGYKNTTGYSSPAFCDPTVFIVNTDLAGDIEINGFADLLPLRLCRIPRGATSSATTVLR